MELKDKRICLHTMGCKVNRAESDTILSLLKKEGAFITEKFEPCDIYIFNTCAVTNEAERKCRNLLTKALKQNPNADIYFLGCSSQNNPERFFHKNVKGVFGTGNKTGVIEAIKSDVTGNFVSEPSQKFEEIEIPQTTRTRAYVKIQDGCNNFCTYCIIPYVRGRSRSREFVCVEKEIRMLSESTKEIVVTGINTANYGKDLEPKKHLLDVCNLFKSLSNKTRFRFSSLEFIKIIDESFLQALADNECFCDQFHLSLQSGSDVVLKSMNRHYTVDEFVDRVNLIRKFFPNAGITTDVIVGFPTETEEEFERTLDTCKKCAFSDIHIFPFSMRDGTAASKLYTQLNGEIVDKRKKRLFDLKEKMRKEFLTGLIGKEQEVLFETCTDGVSEGYSRNFVRCYVNGDESLHNEIKQVVPIKLFNDGLWCEFKK